MLNSNLERMTKEELNFINVSFQEDRNDTLSRLLFSNLGNEC